MATGSLEVMARRKAVGDPAGIGPHGDVDEEHGVRDAEILLTRG